jgi:enterochelin esterase-like enzyme
VPQGTTTRHEIRAEGQDPAIVHTYVPPRYGPDAKPLPLVILFDAKMWMSIDVAATFDNLIADGATRPMIVVAVESIHGATRWQGLTHPEIFEPFVPR